MQILNLHCPRCSPICQHTSSVFIFLYLCCRKYKIAARSSEGGAIGNESYGGVESPQRENHNDDCRVGDLLQPGAVESRSRSEKKSSLLQQQYLKFFENFKYRTCEMSNRLLVSRLHTFMNRSGLQVHVPNRPGFEPYLPIFYDDVFF